MTEHDRDRMYRGFFDTMQVAYLRSLVSDEVIEEYRSNPRGQHSEPLERLLHFFRQAPMEGKYVVLQTSRTGTYRVARLSGRRGVPPSPASSREFETVDEARQDIFQRRISELLGSNPEH